MQVRKYEIVVMCRDGVKLPEPSDLISAIYSDIPTDNMAFDCLGVKDMEIYMYEKADNSKSAELADRLVGAGSDGVFIKE